MRTNTTEGLATELLGRNIFLLQVRARADEIRRARKWVAGLPATTETEATREVLTCLIDLIVEGRPEDYERTAALGVRWGHQRVAELQGELDGYLGNAPHAPYATAAIVKLSQTAQIEAALLRAGRSTSAARRVALRCGNAGFWLLMADIDPSRAAPLPETPEDLRWAVEQCGADAWRQILANVALNPWAPTARELADLARAADLEGPARAIERCALVYRRKINRAERAAVAAEVRRLVAVSGCSQREFAQQVGTSASRISTYSSGRVVPSAAMMLRMRWQSAALAKEYESSITPAGLSRSRPSRTRR